MLVLENSATFSDDGRYRYTLTRALGPPHKAPRAPSPFGFCGTAVFVMLNPSTADAEADDATIRRCAGFARSWGCVALVVVNLYALRATDPRELKTAADPIGPHNARVLRSTAGAYRHLVCAWGARAELERIEQFAGIASGAGAVLWCLGTTAAGAPRHPLRLRADTRLREWVRSDG